MWHTAKPASQAVRCGSLAVIIGSNKGTASFLHPAGLHPELEHKKCVAVCTCNPNSLIHSYHVAVCFFLSGFRGTLLLRKYREVSCFLKNGKKRNFKCDFRCNCATSLSGTPLLAKWLVSVSDVDSGECGGN